MSRHMTEDSENRLEAGEAVPVPRVTDQARRVLQEELTFSLSRAESYRKAMTTVLRKACIGAGWDFAESWIASRDGSILKPGPAWPRVKASLHPFLEASRRIGFPRGVGLPGRVFLSKEPQWMPDVTSAPRGQFSRQSAARAAGLRAALAIPVCAGPDIFAVLVFYAEQELARDDARVEFLVEVLAALGPFLARKKIEDELRVRARQQEAVARLGLEALQESAGMTTLLARVDELCREILEVEFIVLREREGDPPLKPAERSHAGTSLRLGKPIVVEDFDKERRFETVASNERVAASGLCVVIPGRPSPIGTLGVYSMRRRRYTDNDINFMQGVANILGTAIERARTDRELEAHREDLERLVQERTKKLETSHEQLRQAERLASIGTLAAGLGHDMKNLLLPVLCRLDALERSTTDEAQAEVLGVRDSLEYLRKLSHGLRMFALDPDDPDASAESTHLDRWWGEVGTLLEKAVPTGVAFRSEVPADLPEVAVQSHRLTQAVLNLVVNAGEATGGEGEVTVVARPIDEGRAVILAVTDDGHGMSADVQRHALEPFFTRKTRGLSTGLGLSLVHGVAQSAGGSVRIDSKPGVGTTVELTLPAVAAGAVRPTPAGDSEDPLRHAMVSLSDRRITAFVSTMLRAAGYAVSVEPTAPMGTGELWVTAPRTQDRGAIRRFLAEDDTRRVVMLGRPAGARSAPRVRYVDGPTDLEGLRRCLRDTVQELEGIQR